MRRIQLLLLTIVLVTGVVACGKDEKKTAPSSTTKRSTTTTATGTSTTAPCNFAGTTAPQRRNASLPTTYLLTNVTIAASGCIDTITFDFTPQDSPSAEPPYELEYKDPPFAQAGSGEPVTVPGTAFLVIRFQPAWIADLSREGAPPTYTGPHEITATGTSSVKGMALYDAFEAVVGWVIGLDGQHPVRVDESASPPRLVLNVGP